MRTPAPNKIAWIILAITWLAGGAVRGEDPPEWGKGLDEAIAAARANDKNRALEKLNELYLKYPGVAALPYNIAVVYEYNDKGGRYDGADLNAAAAFYRLALTVDPSFTPARFNLAVVLDKMGLGEEAAAEYRIVAKNGGERGRRAEYNLALLLRKNGKPAEARAVIERDKKALDDPARVRLLAFIAEDLGEDGKAILLWKRALRMESSPTSDAVAVRRLQTLRGY